MKKRRVKKGFGLPKKILSAALACGLVAALLPAGVMTYANEGDDAYSVSINDTENGVVSFDNAEIVEENDGIITAYYEDGDDVVLSLFPDEDYVSDTITLLSSNEEIYLEDDISDTEYYSFVMPDDDIMIEGSFVKEETDETAGKAAYDALQISDEMLDEYDIGNEQEYSYNEPDEGQSDTKEISEESGTWSAGTEDAAIAESQENEINGTEDGPSDPGITTYEITQDNIPQGVNITILPRTTALPPSDTKIVFSDAQVEFSDELKDVSWVEEDTSGAIYPYIPLNSDGATINNPMKITSENVAEIDGYGIDAELQITKIQYGSFNNATAKYGTAFYIDSKGVVVYDCVGRYYREYEGATTRGTSLSVSGGSNTSYTLTLKWHDGPNKGEVVKLPFYQVAYDLDIYTSASLIEGYTFNGGIDKYYVYEDNILECRKDEDGVYFGATGKATSGDESYYGGGVIAHSQNGQFSATAHCIYGAYSYFEAYSDYLNVRDPEKTVTTTGSNDNGTFAEGDTVTYAVTQKMGELNTDCFGTYDSLNIIDTIPDELTYQSCEAYIGSEKVASNSGHEISYNDSTRELTWTFPQSWVNDTSNYQGQDLALYVTCTVNSGLVDYDKSITVTNTARSYVSGLEYGPTDCEITVYKEPKPTGNLRVEKTMNPSGANKNTDWTFTVTGNGVDTSKNLTGAGSVTFEDLEEGTYTVTETCNTDYWEPVTKTVTVTSGETETVSIANEATTGTVKIQKSVTDATGCYAGSLSGFTFTLTGTSDIGTSVSLSGTTNNSGTITFNDVYPGTYTVTETSSPDGSGSVGSWWETDKTWQVIVKKDTTVTVDARNIYSAGNVIVEKTMTPGNASQNITWTFRLYGTSDSGAAVDVSKPLTGAGSVSFFNIPVGEYTVEETCNDALWTSVTKKVTVKANDTALVDITNTATTGAVEVQKVINDPNGYYQGDLSGFTFTLTGTSDIGIPVNESAVTDKNGIADFTEIYPGKYTVTETNIGAQWDTAGTWSVTVEKDKAATVTAENIYKTGAINVQKSIIKYEESGRSLSGFAFHLTGVSTEGVSIDLYAVTGSKGIASFGDIPAGTGYTVEEVDKAAVTAAADAGNGSAKLIKDSVTQNLSEYLDTDSQVTGLAYGEETTINFENEVHPAVHVTKTANRSDYNIGDTITYTIEVTETMPGATSHDVEVLDEMPVGMTITGKPTMTGVDGTISADENSVTAEIPELAYTDTAVITVTATPDETLAGTFPVNQVTVDDVLYDHDAASARVEVLRPVLNITNEADEHLYSVNDIVTYTITVSQTEYDAIARNTVMTDTFPDELEVLDAETDTGTVEVDGNNVTAYLGDLNLGNTTSPIAKLSADAPDAAVITVTTKALTDAEEIIDTAYATADYTEAASDSTAIEVRRPTLSIEKDADRETYYAGDTVTYTIQVVNEKEESTEDVENDSNTETADGTEEIIDTESLNDAESTEDTRDNKIPTAYNVVVTDEVPDALELVDVATEKGEVAIDGNTFTVTYPSLYYEEEDTITVTATAHDVDNATVTNTAYVISDTTEEISDYADIDIIKPHLDIQKNIDENIHSLGDDVVYTIDVTQTVEGLTAENVVVTDALPDELALKDVETEGVDGNVETDGNELVASFDAIAYGETATITVTAEAKVAGNDIINTAYADADHADEVADDVEADILKPELSITKTADNSTYNTGDTVEYTIVVSQTVEDAVAKNVVITDMIPDGLTLTGSIKLSGSTGEAALSGSTLTLTLPEVDYGKDVTVTLSAKIGSGAAGKSITNTAYAKGDNADEVNDSAVININTAKATNTSDNPTSTSTPTSTSSTPSSSDSVKTGQGPLSTVLAIIGSLAAIALVVVASRRKKRA